MLAAWLALMVQVPTATSVTVAPLVPDTVQTPVVAEVNVTGLPDGPPVALTVTLVPYTEGEGAVPNEMVCGSCVTVKVCWTWFAAV